MSENVSKLMHLEQLIIKFIDENPDFNDPTIDERFEETHYVERCINLLKKMSNGDVLESLRRFEYVRMFVDFKVFLKKYFLNKKDIKENPKKCLIEYNKINNLCETISQISLNRSEFLTYLKILDVDSATEWLLKYMPNEDLMTLANNSTDWTEKLYYFSHFKKNKGD